MSSEPTPPTKPSTDDATPTIRTTQHVERMTGGKVGGVIVEGPATFFFGEQPTAPPTDDAPAPGVPPFKGLQYFDTDDADLFFGREALTAKLIGRVREQRFLAVVGASGSGKSSLVRAGLVATMRGGDSPLALPESAHWLTHIITPTAHPLEALAASLTRDSESVTATTTLMDDLASDPRSLHLAARRLLSRANAPHLLLVVDQFEELFTACKEPPEREAFVNNLLTAVSLSPMETGEGWGGGDGPTTVVLTLRADFYAHCDQYANLREALAQHQEFIGQMEDDELCRAIEAPAAHNGWTLEAGLVERLLQDVGAEPGALPLLSHALLETWKRRHGRMLTLSGYQASGGVRGAIAQTAEAVFGSFQPEQQIVARQIFTELTELGEGTQMTRRRAALDDLRQTVSDDGSFDKVLRALVSARLVTAEQSGVEVAHEAVIREWPRLRRWLNEDREALRVRRRLADDAQTWAQHGRDASYLYTGARLATVREQLVAKRVPLGSLTQEFVAAAIAADEAMQAARQQGILHEFERKQILYLRQAFGGALGSGLGWGLAFALIFLDLRHAALDVFRLKVAVLAGLAIFPLGGSFGLCVGLCLWRWRAEPRRQLAGTALVSTLVGAAIYVVFLLTAAGGISDALQIAAGALLGAGLGVGAGLNLGRTRRLFAIVFGGLLAAVAAAVLTRAPSDDVLIAAVAGLVMGGLSGLGFYVSAVAAEPGERSVAQEVSQ